MAQTPKDKQPDLPSPRRGWATPLGMEASLAAQSAFARAGFADPTVILRWDEIAGAETAALAKPVSLKEGPGGGVLTLKAEPGAALFLQHDAPALCERINSFLGRSAVNRLRFVQGPLTQRIKSAPRKVSKQPVPAADPAQKYQGPEGLRTALLSLARTRRGQP